MCSSVYHANPSTIGRAARFKAMAITVERAYGTHLGLLGSMLQEGGGGSPLGFFVGIAIGVGVELSGQGRTFTDFTSVVTSDMVLPMVTRP